MFAAVLPFAIFQLRSETRIRAQMSRAGRPPTAGQNYRHPAGLSYTIGRSPLTPAPLVLLPVQFLAAHVYHHAHNRPLEPRLRRL